MRQRTTNTSPTHPPICHLSSPTLGLIITHFISSSSAPSLQILEDLDEQIYCIHLQEEALQRRLNGMSVGDVLAHYRGGEGLTALLGVMERTTLESISIENSATHTWTDIHRHWQENPHTLDSGLSPPLSYSHNFLLKGKAATWQGPYFMFRKFLRIHLRHSSVTVTAGEMIASFNIRPRMVTWVIRWK